MGIEYVLDVRHHRGHADRYCPRVRCDACRELIEDAGNGNVWWPWVGEERGSAGTTPVFAHKQCPDQGHLEPAWTPGELPATWSFRSDFSWLSEELTHFLIYLVENTGIDYAQERKLVLELATLE